MGVKITMSKAVTDGEAVVVELTDKDMPSAMAKLQECFDQLDHRMRDKNLAIFDAMKVARSLPAEAQQALKASVDILHGRATLSDELRASLEAREAEAKLKADKVRLESHKHRYEEDEFMELLSHVVETELLKQQAEG